MDIFFIIYGACKAIDVDTRREVVIKTLQTSANNRSISISQEPTAQYCPSANISPFPKSQLHNVFSKLKTWKTSANNRPFSISQEPTAQ